MEVDVVNRHKPLLFVKLQFRQDLRDQLVLRLPTLLYEFIQTLSC